MCLGKLTKMLYTCIMMYVYMYMYVFSFSPLSSALSPFPHSRRSLSWLCGHMSLERQAMIPVQLCDKLRVAVGSLEESLEHYRSA